MAAQAPLAPSPDRHAWWPALGFAALALTIVLGTILAAPPVGQMAVVFPPFTDELTAWALVAEAGGLLVAPTNASNIVVAYAPDPQFQSRIRDLGALFFVAATGLCTGPAANPQEPT